MPPDTVPGSCFCGAVRFRVEMPTSACVHCHCSMCRRIHGSAYVTWIEVERPRLSFEHGEDRLHWYDSSNHGRRSFCRDCGSAIFCEIAERPEHIDIVLANLDGPVDREPQLHIFWDDRAPWTVVGDELPRLGGETGMKPVEG